MTLQVNAGSRATAASIDQMVTQGIVKPADESVTSSVTLQNDNDLVLPVLASASYLFACYLDYEGGTQGSSDLKWTWVIPAGAILRYQTIYVSTGNVLAGGTTQLGSDVIAAGSKGAGVLMGVTMIGGLVMSTTAGSLQLQWAQNTSNATPTIVHKASTISLQRTA